MTSPKQTIALDDFRRLLHERLHPLFEGTEATCVCELAPDLIHIFQRFEGAPTEELIHHITELIQFKCMAVTAGALPRFDKIPPKDIAQSILEIRNHLSG